MWWPRVSLGSLCPGFGVQRRPPSLALLGRGNALPLLIGIMALRDTGAKLRPVKEYRITENKPAVSSISEALSQHSQAQLMQDMQKFNQWAQDLLGKEGMQTPQASDLSEQRPEHCASRGLCYLLSSCFW